MPAILTELYAILDCDFVSKARYCCKTDSVHCVRFVPARLSISPGTTITKHSSCPTSAEESTTEVNLSLYETISDISYYAPRHVCGDGCYVGYQLRVFQGPVLAFPAPTVTLVTMTELSGIK